MFVEMSVRLMAEFRFVREIHRLSKPSVTRDLAKIANAPFGHWAKPQRTLPVTGQARSRYIELYFP
jgi:hypothetical protein